MPPDPNGGWCDTEESVRETLAQWERPCGKRLVESRQRIESAHRLISDSRKMIHHA